MRAWVVDGSEWSQQTRSPSTWDPQVTLWPLDEVLRETARMHSGDSEQVRRRVQTIAQAEGVLSL